jgi:murein DD-endopeptidase MepM/ murein hydrolase activator NlpD
VKTFLGLAAVAFLFICFLAYGFQNVMFPAVIAVAADQAAKSIPGYEGQIADWMLSDKPGAAPAASLAYTSSVLTPFDGYSGPTGFYSCGPYFIQMPEVVITTLYHEDEGVNARCGCEYYHTGIDYATLHQYPTLLAPMSGKVVFAGFDRSGYGNLVVLENAGVRVYLAHLSAFAVTQGQIVRAGTPVGAIGSTGNSSGPHLHFEVRIRDPKHSQYGLIVDPSTVLLPGESAACNWTNGQGDGYVWKLR